MSRIGGHGPERVAVKKRPQLDEDQFPGRPESISGSRGSFRENDRKGLPLPHTATAIPTFPPLFAAPFRGLPLAPLSVALTLYARNVARTHPGLFRRLGEHAHKRYVLDPTDLPFAILLEPNGGTPKVHVSRRALSGDARIAGSLAALLGMVHGAYDGDALFFSRDLVIEGDTGAALALRNAIDDAELDLSAEAARLSGPLARPLQRLFALAERRTGVSLSRPEEAQPW